MHDLQDNFDENIRKTKKSFKEEHLHEIIDYIQTHAKSLLGPSKKHQRREVEAVEKDFDNIQSIKDLFKVLQYKYISWFNYELIVKLVRVFLSNNRSLKRAWSSYEVKLKDYFTNSGGLLREVEAIKFGITDAPHGTRVMIAQVDHDNYTLDDLFFFRRAIPKKLNIPHIKIYFRRVHCSSLHLEHLIPDYLYSLLFPLTEELQQQLASIGIIELTCGKHVYHLKEVS